MVISLPWLWVVGHLAAALGILLVLAQLAWPHRAIAMAGALGGAASCVTLAYILNDVNRSFGGTYEFLAWAIAFLAGYATVAGVWYSATAVMVIARSVSPASASAPR